MSLINDALRQASQTHKQQAGAASSRPTAPPPPAPEPARLPPVVAPVPPISASPWPSLLKLAAVLVLAVGVVGAGAFTLRKAWSSHRSQVVAQAANQNQSAPATEPPVTAASPTEAASVPATPNVSEATPVPAPKTLGAPAAATGPSADKPAPNAFGAAESTASATPQTVTTPAPPVKWPTLRLQGLFFRPPDSSVVINNKTLYTDDEIQGVKVAQIERTGVTLSLNGETKVLLVR